MNDPHKPARYRARTVAALDWSPRFGALPDRFFTRLSPTPLPEPYLVAYNTAAADLAGIDPGAHVDDALVECLAGNRVPPGATPWAAVYAGHQFGVYVPQLGDGRAISLGEVVGSAGVCEIQLKGAGRTPYSRMGDGRAVLRSSIREFLCSEAMAGLGIIVVNALADSAWGTFTIAATGLRNLHAQAAIVLEGRSAVFLEALEKELTIFPGHFELDDDGNLGRLLRHEHFPNLLWRDWCGYPTAR